MRMRWKVTYRGPLGEKIKRMREFAREALDGAARLWSKEYRKRHFERSARRRYDYDPRSLLYQRQKNKRYARGLADYRSAVGNASARPTPAMRRFGVMDLVWSGELWERFVGAAMYRRQAKAVKTYLNVPKHALYHTGQMGQPDIPKELTTVAPDEEVTLLRIVESIMARRLNEPTPVVTERI